MKRYQWCFGRLLLPILAFLSATTSVWASPIELSLDNSVAMALKNNPAMQIAEAGRGKSLWAIKQAQAGMGINLSFQHSDSRYNYPPDLTGLPAYSYHTKYDNQMSLSLPVYSGGKLERQTDEAQLNLTVAEFTLKATSQQVKLSAISAYYDAVQYWNLLQVNQEAVQNLTAHLHNVERQFETGLVARSDALYSQVQLAIAQDSLIRAQTNYDNAVTNLNNVIGLSQGSEVKLKNDFTYIKYSLGLEECIQYALVNRPEMGQAKANIAIAQDDIKISQSGNLPAVTFQGKQDWYDQDLPGAKNKNWQVSLTASLNVFDSGLTKSQIEQANFNLDTVQEKTRQTQDSITLEVRQDYHSMHDAEKRINTAKLAVEKAEENFKIAEIGYSAGMDTNIGVIDAETALTQAKTNYIQALYDYNTSKAQLDKAMGISVQ